MIQFRELTIYFDPTRGIKQRESASASFSGRRIKTAQAVLKGFNLKYTDGDHHVYEQEIDLDTIVRGDTVQVFADFLIRDSSGHIDDRYHGFVQAVVIADLE